MARKKNYDLYSGYSWYMPGVRGMFVLLGMFILGGLLGSLIQAVLMLFMTPDQVMSYGMIVVYPAQFMPAMIYAMNKSRKNAFFDTGYALDSKNFGKMGAAGAALVTIAVTAATMFLADYPNWWNASLAQKSSFLSQFYDIIMEAMKTMTGGPLWSSFLVVAIFAPVFEEWLCRGMVLRGLLRNMKPGWAIVVSALFFALIHANPWQALNAFIIGVVMGYIYYKTGSLLLTMLIHFVNNGTSVILSDIDALKDFDYFKDMMPAGTYIAGIVAAAVVMAAGIWLFSRIPLRHPWGNIDEVEAIAPEEI